MCTICKWLFLNGSSLPPCDCDCEKRERKDDVENLVGEDLHNREGVQEGKDRELVDGWGAFTQECWGVDRSIPHGVLPSKRKKGPEECQFLPPDKPCGFVLIGPSKAGGSFLWIVRTDLNLVIYMNFNQHANQRPKEKTPKSHKELGKYPQHNWISLTPTSYHKPKKKRKKTKRKKNIK